MYLKRNRKQNLQINRIMVVQVIVRYNEAPKYNSPICQNHVACEIERTDEGKAG